MHNAAQIEPASSHTTHEASPRSRWAERTILFLLLIVALAIPFSTKLAVHAFRLAAIVWLIRLVVYRPKLRRQPLIVPIVLFVVLAAISSAFSYEPSMSWDRMRTVSLILMVPLITQSLCSLRQVRVLTIALLLGVVAAVTYTGWQSTFGVGVALSQIKPGSPLDRAGLMPGNIITRINGQRMHSPSALRELLEHGSGSEVLQVSMVRGAPPERHELQFARAALVESGLTLPGALSRGHPERAQGFFTHYVPFSELLMLVAALLFGLVIASGKANLPTVVSGVAFLAITAALVSTVTRATFASLAIACAVVLWINGRWKKRAITAAAMVIIFVLGSFWFRHERGTGWFAANDASSQYRELMWRDGLRLSLQHPWFGVGMDSIYRHWQEWDIQAYQHFPNLKSHFHSSYIQIATECGLPALAAWLWILIAYLFLLVRYLKVSASHAAFYRGVLLGALAASIAFGATSVFHYVSGDAEFMIAFWFLAGLALGTGEMLRSRMPDRCAAK